MASMSFIWAAEAALPDINVSDMVEAFEGECRTNNGHPYSENRDSWGTLMMNCLAMVKDNPNLAPLIEAMKAEFPGC